VLSANNIIQSSSGSFNATSGSVTLPGGTTAGNTVIVVVATGANIAPDMLTGFVADVALGFTLQTNRVFHRGPTEGLAGGETSWTVTLASTGLCAWATFEVSGLDAVTPKDTSSGGAEATATSIGTGNLLTAPTAYDLMVLAVHGGYNSLSAAAPTWSGQTNSYTELKDQGAVGASTAVGLSVSVKFMTTPTFPSCTATSTLGTAGPVAGIAVAYAAADAHRQIDADVIAGYEIGPVTGLIRPGGYIAAGLGTPAIVSTNPRTGSYCLELSSVAATCSAIWDSLLGSTVKVFRQPLYFPGSLPGSDMELMSLSGTFGLVQVWFRVATGKIGVIVNNSLPTAGTEQLSAASVVPDTWHVIEMRLSTILSTYTLDWRLDAVDQTQATVAGTAGFQITAAAVGWGTARTATVRYDDTVVMNKAANYARGNFTVVLLPVDPAGTLTLSGTATNFNTFTANGTLAAWDATVAKTNITETLPPVIGASAAGFCQVATAATNYVEIPMSTYQGITDAVRSVRMIVCGWAASTSAANIRFRSWDGTTEVILLAATDSSYDNVIAVWNTVMVKSATGGTGPEQGWPQARLDALALRVGFSTDAAPACGIHWIGAEVLVQPGDVERIMSVEDKFFVDKCMDAESSAALSYVVTVPADRGATFDTVINGTPASHYVAAGSAPYQQVVQAVDFTVVTSTGLSPDPDPNLA
jgi:hypothetical protein